MSKVSVARNLAQSHSIGVVTLALRKVLRSSQASPPSIFGSSDTLALTRRSRRVKSRQSKERKAWETERGVGKTKTKTKSVSVARSCPRSERLQRDPEKCLFRCKRCERGHAFIIREDFVFRIKREKAEAPLKRGRTSRGSSLLCRWWFGWERDILQPLSREARSGLPDPPSQLSRFHRTPSKACYAGNGSLSQIHSQRMSRLRAQRRRRKPDQCYSKSSSRYRNDDHLHLKKSKEATRHRSK